jgi:hypothetical protein
MLKIDARQINARRINARRILANFGEFLHKTIVVQNHRLSTDRI